MKLLARLNRPWVHFIVLGSLLFYLQGVFFPAPKPVIGPLVTREWRRCSSSGSPVSAGSPRRSSSARMVQAELDRDMLFARALELKLHLYDTVVYQRLLLNMRFPAAGGGTKRKQSCTSRHWICACTWAMK